ncbi:MAG TPA: histidine kinase [Flavobacteriales bacterium]|nr:histidine kinase [Flavobacteriales bacterium]
MRLLKNALFCLFLGFFSLHTKAQLSSDSLLQSYKNKLLHDTIRLQSLMLLVEELPDGEWEAYNKIMYDFATRKLNLKCSVGEHKRYAYYKGVACFNYGVDFAQKMKIETSNRYYLQSIKLFKQCGSSDYIAFAQLDIAKNYSEMRNFTEAGILLYKALNYFESIHDAGGLGDVYYTLATIHLKQLEYKKAVPLLEKAFKAYKSIGFKYGMVLSIGALSNAQAYGGDHKSQIETLKKGIAMIGETKDADLLMYVNWFKGQMYLEQNNIDSAMIYLKSSYELVVKLGKRKLIAPRCRFLSFAYLAKKDFRNALYYAQMAYDISLQDNDLKENCGGALRLFDAYKKMGNYKKALEMHERYKLLNDSLRRKEDSEKLIEQEYKYKFEKRRIQDKVNEKLRISNLKASHQNQTNQKNIQIIVLVFLALILLAGGFTIYRFYRQRSLINEQKSAIIKQKLLVSQLNPHFVFNSLNVIQNYIFKQDSLQAGAYLAQFAQLMRMILEYSRKEYVTVNEEFDLMKNYLELQQLRFDQKFDFILEHDPKLDAESVVIPPMLAQPFIENAIEHGLFFKEGKGHVWIRLKHHETGLMYEIEDDGVGIEKAMHMRGQQTYKHKSLATVITRERIDELNQNSSFKASVEITDKNANGTGSGVIVKFTLPFKHI